MDGKTYSQLMPIEKRKMEKIISVKKLEQVKKMEGIVFAKLIQNLKPESDSNLDQVALRSKYKEFEVNIYADDKTDYNLVVEDFGKNTDNGWSQMTPTEIQLSYLRSQINKEIKRLELEAHERKLEHQKREREIYEFRNEETYLRGHY